MDSQWNFAESNKLVVLYSNGNEDFLTGSYGAKLWKVIVIFAGNQLNGLYVLY